VSPKVDVYVCQDCDFVTSYYDEAMKHSKEKEHRVGCYKREDRA